MYKPRYQMSPDELAQAGRAGDHEATLLLAHFAQYGLRGVPEDHARSLTLIQEAAGAGYPRAMCELGDRFGRGDGVERNDAVATRWWRNAAAGGDSDAMSNLLYLRESHDPQEVAEGNHWLRTAASMGHPHALHIQGGGHAMSMEQFSAMSLDDMAAAAPLGTGNELSWEREEVKGTLAQINDLVGHWLERLRPTWPGIRTRATVSGDEVDFPCPDPRSLPGSIDADNDTIEVTIRSGVAHLQLDASKWDEGWTFTLSSYEPHPPPQAAQWIVGELRAAGADVRLAL